jgi:hypothetical protein
MDDRARIIHEQTLIVAFSREGFIASLKDLLPDRESRELALKVVQYIPGPIDEMAPHTLDLLQEIHQTLRLSPVSENVIDDPLADGKIGTAAE